MVTTAALTILRSANGPGPVDSRDIVTDVPLTVAEVARAAELKYTPAASALATLERRGLVRRVRWLDSDGFEPDRDDLHYPMAYGTARVDLPIADVLRGQRVQAVVAYGSLASAGGGNAGSDLDLLIIGDVADRARVIDALAALGARIGRSIDPFIATPRTAGASRPRARSACRSGAPRRPRLRSSLMATPTKAPRETAQNLRRAFVRRGRLKVDAYVGSDI